MKGIDLAIGKYHEERRVLGCLALVAIATISGLGAASAERIPYDPESCATATDGKVFVRLFTGLSFAFPAWDLGYLGGPPPEPGDIGPIADPDEPEGCPLNPIVTQHFSVRYRPVAARHPAEGGGERWHPRGLRIYSFNGPTGIQDFYVEMFAESCINPLPSDDRTHRLVDYPALQECRLEQPGHADDRDWPSFLVARPGLHPEANDRRFVVHCRGMTLLPGAPRTCEVRYEIEVDPRSSTSSATASCRARISPSSTCRSGPSSRRAGRRSTMSSLTGNEEEVRCLTLFVDVDSAAMRSEKIAEVLLRC